MTEERTVLLVEDSDDTREVYGTFLRHHGYRVIEARNGAEGVRAAREERPDVIVMNVALPHLDGLSATRELKQDPATSDIPIIACTGLLRSEAEGAAEEAGVDQFLEKPCEPSRIMEVIERFVAAGGIDRPE